jgi:hypothetical protein
LPVRADDSLFKRRPDNSENYWRFFSGTDDFTIDVIVDYYKSMITMNPSDSEYAAWAHAAWDAKRTNTALQWGPHWETFTQQIRPLFETRIDWELIAACHGFLLCSDNARNAEIAAYTQTHLIPNGRSSARPLKTDSVIFNMLSLCEPTSPWGVYTLLSGSLDPGLPLDSYPLDFN